ncbi:MAG: (2Fe-2S)-binding protein [Acidimicrobiales bacterium]
MLICHCRAVNDRAIRAAYLAGARDADEIGRRCGAGGRCGGCLPGLREFLDQLDARVGAAGAEHLSAA